MDFIASHVAFGKHVFGEDGIEFFPRSQVRQHDASLRNIDVGPDEDEMSQIKMFGKPFRMLLK